MEFEFSVLNSKATLTAVSPYGTDFKRSDMELFKHWLDTSDGRDTFVEKLTLAANNNWDDYDLGFCIDHDDWIKLGCRLHRIPGYLYQPVYKVVLYSNNEERTVCVVTLSYTTACLAYVFYPENDENDLDI